MGGLPSSPEQLVYALGVIGIIIGFFVWSLKRQQMFLQTLVQNHMKHNTESLDNLIIAIERMSSAAEASATAAATAATTAQQTAFTLQNWLIMNERKS